MTDDNVLLRREIAWLGQRIIDLKADIAKAVEEERAACEDIARRLGDEEIAAAIAARKQCLP